MNDELREKVDLLIRAYEERVDAFNKGLHGACVEHGVPEATYTALLEAQGEAEAAAVALDRARSMSPEIDQYVQARASRTLGIPVYAEAEGERFLN